jgi:hypothetical protein
MKIIKKVCRVTIILALLVLALGILSACSNDGEDAFVGTWANDVYGFQYILRADGSGSRGIPPDLQPITWRRENRYFIVTDGGFTEYWGYTMRGNTITFTHESMPGYVFVYNRR